jgi:hypothetical protein
LGGKGANPNWILGSIVNCEMGTKRILILIYFGNHRFFMYAKKELPNIETKPTLNLTLNLGPNWKPKNESEPQSHN